MKCKWASNAKILFTLLRNWRCDDTSLSELETLILFQPPTWTLLCQQVRTCFESRVTMIRPWSDIHFTFISLCLCAFFAVISTTGGILLVATYKRTISHRIKVGLKEMWLFHFTLPCCLIHFQYLESNYWNLVYNNRYHVSWMAMQVQLAKNVYSCQKASLY